MASIKILQSGPLSTIQDKGRYGYMQFGMMPAGAMDEFSMNIANLLVGNDKSEAVIESAYIGPRIEFDGDEIIAVTGGETDVKLNGDPVPMWQSLEVKTGDVLQLSPVKAGLYTYIAFSRGLDVPLIMGSKSTYMRGKLGGLEGRKLQVGDVIELGEVKKTDPALQLDPGARPGFAKERTLRVVMGPQEDHFTEEGIETFLSREYTITQEADRMGYRLDGEPIEHKTGPDVISDGIAHGTIQVPGNGLPIVLLSDRGTTGGYTKIATMIAQDICTLVQMSPGATIRFEAISAAQANQLYRDFFGNLSSLLIAVEPEVTPGPAVARPEQSSYTVMDGFKEYQVQLEGREYLVRVKKL